MRIIGPISPVGVLDPRVLAYVIGPGLVEARGNECGIGHYPYGEDVRPFAEEPPVDGKTQVAEAAVDGDGAVRGEMHLALHQRSVQVDLPIVPESGKEHAGYQRRLRAIARRLPDPAPTAPAIRAETWKGMR